MPNWASTDYVVEGKQETLQLIFETIDTFMKGEKNFPKDSCKEWEGNVIHELEKQNNLKKDEKSYLRGFFIDYHIDENLLYINAEEAWGATDFRHCLEKIYPDIKVYFKVEENGCEVYATNDGDGKFFSERYLIDYSIDGRDDIEYFNDEKRMLQYAAKRINKEKTTIEEIEQWNEKHNKNEDENYIYIHAFQIVS